MRTAEVELNYFQFKQLNIDPEEVKKHYRKSALNRTVTEFLNKSEHT